jgi:hypothetical protein
VSERPLLRVVTGSPTPEELAILTAVVTAAAARSEPEPPQRVRRGGWGDPAARLRQPLLPGPNAWRASAR